LGGKPDRDPVRDTTQRGLYENIRCEENAGQDYARNDAPRPPPNRPKPKGSDESRGMRRIGGDAWKPGPGKSQADIDRCLRILELEPGKTYTKKEIKKAYRRLAMIHHPDLPMGSHDDAFVRLDMASDYLMKHLAA
jgi:hypothetical protein